MIALEDIRNIHKKFWKPGYGSISAKEAYFIQLGINEHKPKRFIEIGTASGLSTGFIGLFLQENAGEELISLDFDTTFWLDRSKPTGFLAEEIFKNERINIDFIRGENSTFIAQNVYPKKFDMAFIDANHQHPWPILDMISVLPSMQSGALIYHHDLALYKQQTPVFGIGPKYLYDQMPEELKQVIGDPEKNIYYIKTPKNYRDLEKILIDALYLPWTIRNKIEDSIVDVFSEIANDFWSEELSEAIKKTAVKFNLK